MLVIQAQQFQRWRETMADAFVQRMLDHIHAHFPNHWRVAGPDALGRLVRLGRERAAAHGFERQREVGQYVNLMLLLGADFDRDPLLPWAGQALAFRRSECSARMDRVYDKALDFLDATAGTRNQHLEAALLRVRQAARQGWRAPQAVSFGPLVRAQLQWAFPQRAAAAGESAFHAATAQAARRAAACGLVQQSDALLYMGLAFMLGSGFAEDPQFPWAGQALLARPGDGAADRGQRLRTAALQTLDRWMDG